MAALRIGLILILVSFVLPLELLAVDDSTSPGDGEPGAEDSVVIAQEAEQFRGQMIGFLHEMENALSDALKHPALTQRVEAGLAANMLQIPFKSSTYAVFEDATDAELDQLRSAFVQVPRVLEIPGILTASLDKLSQPDMTDSSLAAACQDNYAEYANAISKQGATRGLTRALDGTAFFFSILNTFTEVLGAATEDTPYVGKIPSLPFVIIRGIFDVVRIAMSFAKEDLSFQGTLSELCVAACLTDTGDVHGDPSERWRGRGCDNRDNNCSGGIDEDSEDMFAPVVSVDAAIIGQCFGDTSSAQSAAVLAVKTIDDCSVPTFNVNLGAVSPSTCKAGFSVTAQDRAGNSTNLTGAHLRLTIDGQPPVLALPVLDACYPTINSARNAFTGPGFSMTDCTAVDLAIDIVEKECVADLEVTAVDACDNQSSARLSVRVDATAPEIDIARLKIPSIEGLHCLNTEADAITAVREATDVFDRCTATEDLILNTSTSGPACNLQVTSTAQDECGHVASDSLFVRVDAEAPVVSCSVEQSILHPASDDLIDVGFQLLASDNCDLDGPEIEIQVTSDEPTALAFSAVAGDDLYPDAVIDRAADGSVERVWLRAQRSQEGKADGRVYRIRVIATDSCGLQNVSDCYVTVPRTKPGPGSAINSGQGFNAVQFN